jgi:hypothetical protein
MNTFEKKDKALEGAEPIASPSAVNIDPTAIRASIPM